MHSLPVRPEPSPGERRRRKHCRWNAIESPKTSLDLCRIIVGQRWLDALDIATAQASYRRLGGSRFSPPWSLSSAGSLCFFSEIVVRARDAPDDPKGSWLCKNCWDDGLSSSFSGMLRPNTYALITARSGCTPNRVSQHARWVDPGRWGKGRERKGVPCTDIVMRTLMFHSPYEADPQLLLPIFLACLDINHGRISL